MLLAIMLFAKLFIANNSSVSLRTLLKSGFKGLRVAPTVT